MKDLVETVLGVVLVASFALAGFILPSVLIDMVAGTDVTGPVATALMIAVSAGALLGVLATCLPRHTDHSRHRSPHRTPNDKSLGALDDDGHWPPH